MAGGTPVRLATHGQDRVALLVSCQTRLVGIWRRQLGRLEYDGNRAVVLDPARPLPEAELREMVTMALTYRRGGAGPR